MVTNFTDILTKYFEHVNDKASYLDKITTFKTDLLHKASLAYLTDWDSKFHINNIFNFLLANFTIKYTETVLNSRTFRQMYLKNPISQIYQPLTRELLAEYVDVIMEPTKTSIDLIKTCDQLLAKLNARYEMLSMLNPLPKHHCGFTNGFYICKENLFIDKDDVDKLTDKLGSYDFIVEPYLTYIREPHLLEHKYNLWQKFITDLANGQEDQIKLFKQLIYAAVEGYGRGKYVMLCGTPGSGKSTLGRIITHVAGLDNVHHLTLDKFGDHNSLNTIKRSTKVIFGDDLQKSTKVVGESLRIFKTLIDGNPVSLNAKFKDNVIVQSDGLWLQMMNDIPSIYESNDAIKGRALLVNITAKNHRDTLDPTERATANLLDDYTAKTGNNPDLEFLSVIVSDCFNTLEYFDRFTISHQMIKDTADMIDQSNPYKAFVSWLVDAEVTAFEKLPNLDLYAAFDHWLKTHNPSMPKPSLTKLTREIKPYMEELGYKNGSASKPMPKKLISYNRQVFCDATGLNPKFLGEARSTLWSKTTKIDEQAVLAELKMLRDKKHPYDELSLEQLIVAEHHVAKFDADFIQWKHNLLN